MYSNIIIYYIFNKSITFERSEMATKREEECTVESMIGTTVEVKEYFDINHVILIWVNLFHNCFKHWTLERSKKKPAWYGSRKWKKNSMQYMNSTVHWFFQCIYIIIEVCVCVCVCQNNNQFKELGIYPTRIKMYMYVLHAYSICFDFDPLYL